MPKWILFIRPQIDPATFKLLFQFICRDIEEQLGKRFGKSLLEIYYYKINLCMLKRASKEPTEQAEAKAISNLLEIDLKSHE